MQRLLLKPEDGERRDPEGAEACAALVVAGGQAAVRASRILNLDERLPRHAESSQNRAAPSRIKGR